jgi:ABC-type glycerol-3-phosphate transport system substrate-binding protein
MKVELFNLVSRRSALKGGLAISALGVAGAIGALPRSAGAADDLRTQLLKVPGVGKGSPTDADWQKVGELCLGGTKANIKEGEFKGVELTFMGLNNQNLHNLLFRGFLKPWEAHTGAKINWIDLAQADYNPRLQQAIATGTVDFDIVEMGAPFEGDVCGKGLASEMPDWVKGQIDMDDYVGYLKAPVGTWNGKTYRISIDGDCHTFNYRTDYFSDPELAKAWKAEGGAGEWGVPKTWQQVQAVTKFLKGKTVAGQDAYGYLDPTKPWGGFGFYFLGSRATAYAKHPDDPAWLFDADTMKARINNPAWVRAIQDVIDALPFEPADQLNADPGTTGFQQFLAGTGSMLSWWGDIGSNAKTSDSSVIGDSVGFSILPPDDVYNSKTGAWDNWRAANMRRTWPISAGAFMSWPESIATRSSKRRPGVRRPISAGRTSRSGRRPILPAFSPIATAISTFRNGLAPATMKPSSRRISTPRRIPTTIRMPRSNRASPASSSITALPRTSCPRSGPAVRMPRPAPTGLPQPGKRSRTRSVAKTRSNSTRRRSASDRRVVRRWRQGTGGALKVPPVRIFSHDLGCRFSHRRTLTGETIPDK